MHGHQGPSCDHLLWSHPYPVSLDLSGAVHAVGHPFLFTRLPSSPPGPLILTVLLPLAATPWSLCSLLRCEVLGSAGSSALPTRLTPPVSSPLASCLLSADSTDSHLSSRHLHVDVRGPSAQPPCFPSNLSFSQFLTPSCCSKTMCMLVGSRL